MSDFEDSPPAKDISQIRRKHPCVLCQQRKVRCDRNDPCANCTKSRVECVSGTTIPPKRRKKRFPEAELLARIRRYEEHLKAYGADIDAINRGEPPPASKGPLAAKISVQQLEAGCRALSVRRSLKHVENNFWSGVNDEFREAEQILEGSSEDEMFESPFTKTYDEISPDGDDLLFEAQYPDNITLHHPPPVQIFRLWQTFLDNIHPVMKLLHAPTVQQKILDACADLENVPREMQVLMFGIYCLAITSLEDPECRAMFGQGKEEMLKHYQKGCRQALLRASFLRTSNLTILSGYVLYLTSCVIFTIDPRALFCLTGIAIRIAQRMGLNYDGSIYGLNPFETEMRRRLWWHLVFLDNRVGEVSGAGGSMIQHLRTTQLPLNVNDSDLFPGMKETPIERPGATEMIYALPRYEAGKLLVEHKSSEAPVKISEEDLKKFEQRLQEKYLQYCDPQIPVHLLSILSTRTALMKLQIGSQHPRLDTLGKLTDSEKERYFRVSLGMIEQFNLMASSKILAKFHWHIYKTFPFPAHIYVLVALRSRTSDELAEQAWRLIQQHADIKANSPFSRTKLAEKMGHSALHLAMANLTVKAWDARDDALRPFQPLLETPPVIIELRERLARKKSSYASSSTTQSSNPSPPTQVESFNGDSFGDPFGWMTTQSGLDQGFSGFEQPGISTGMGIGMGMGMGAMPTGVDWGVWDDYSGAQATGMPGFEGSEMPKYYGS